MRLSVEWTRVNMEQWQSEFQLKARNFTYSGECALLLYKRCRQKYNIGSGVKPAGSMLELCRLGVRPGEGRERGLGHLYVWAEVWPNWDKSWTARESYKRRVRAGHWPVSERLAWNCRNAGYCFCGKRHVGRRAVTPHSVNGRKAADISLRNTAFCKKSGSPRRTS